MSSCVPCLCWVPKGAAKEVPDKVQLSKDEIQQLLQGAQAQLKELGLKDKAAPGPTGSEDSGPDDGDRDDDDNVEALYDLDNYDEGEQVSGAGMGNSLAGLSYFASNEEDPYITLKKAAPEDDDEDDYRVLPTDNMLVIGRAEEDFSSLEVHVYSESDDHMYSHHEILLTAFPLALEWVDFDPEQPDKKGNYVAVGTMSPVIEVWDLDMVDSLEPVFVLGDPSHLAVTKLLKDKAKKKEKKSKKSPGASVPAEIIEGHSDAVLGLSWNRLVRNIMASASADKTVRVWDMSWPKCVLTLKHKDKVQCVQWHPYTPELLATGGYNKFVRLYNCKSSEKALRSWNVKGEVERLLWNHLKPEQLLVSTDANAVWCLNKDDGSVVFQIHAHTGPITAVSLSALVPGLLVTASSDDSVKFWDIHDNQPVFLFNRDMHMGSVHCAQFCNDGPYALAVGGEKNGFHVIDTGRLLPVTQRFKKRGFMVSTDSSNVAQDDSVDKSSEDGIPEDEEGMDTSEVEDSNPKTKLSDSPKHKPRDLASFSANVNGRSVKSKKVISPKKKSKTKRRH